MDFPFSPAEQQKLQTKQRSLEMDKLMRKQAETAKELKHLNTIPIFRRNMKRLQCRSYPLGVDIIIDGKHTEKVTPWTFEDLDEGKHEVEMHYVEPETGEVIAKKEEVDIKQGKRAICKMHFKTPRTLADVGELGK